MRFKEKLRAREGATLACIGLDPVAARLPVLVRERLGRHTCGMLSTWALRIVDVTAPSALAFKPNIWFWLAFGGDGLSALEAVCSYIRTHHPHITLIIDFKGGDIGATVECMAELVFGRLGADAVTASPYLGIEELRPLFTRGGVIVLAKTSNKSSVEFQNLKLRDVHRADCVYEEVALNVAEHWNQQHDVFGLVAGATHVDDVQKIRAIVGDAVPLLLPGFGKQGAKASEVIPVALDSRRGGVIASSSSAVTYPEGEGRFEDLVGNAAQAFMSELNAVRG